MRVGTIYKKRRNSTIGWIRRLPWASTCPTLLFRRQTPGSVDGGALAGTKIRNLRTVKWENDGNVQRGLLGQNRHRAVGQIR